MNILVRSPKTTFSTLLQLVEEAGFWWAGCQADDFRFHTGGIVNHSSGEKLKEHSSFGGPSQSTFCMEGVGLRRTVYLPTEYLVLAIPMYLKRQGSHM